MTEDAPGALPLVVVDAANVVGSVPDGWWRDRAGATERLRDRLADVGSRGLPGSVTGAPAWAYRPPFEVVLVVEGAARRVEGTDVVRVLSAAGSGDDAVVEVVRESVTARPCLVVTADRELRSRVTALGADVIGPRALPRGR